MCVRSKAKGRRTCGTWERDDRRMGARRADVLPGVRAARLALFEKGCDARRP